MVDRFSDSDRGRYYGVYPALVVDINDPDGEGRVKIKLSWSPDPSGADYEAWARIATLMAGDGRGSWFIPELDDEVLMCFEAGEPKRPYVIVGAFVLGMLLTPPDAISQTLLALPMWVLFELGIVCSRLYVGARGQRPQEDSE